LIGGAGDLAFEPSEVLLHERALAEEFLKAVGHAVTNRHAARVGPARHKKAPEVIRR
jgi:hypothetical protein